VSKLVVSAVVVIPDVGLVSKLEVSAVVVIPDVGLVSKLVVSAVVTSPTSGITTTADTSNLPTGPTSSMATTADTTNSQNATTSGILQPPGTTTDTTSGIITTLSNTISLFSKSSLTNIRNSLSVKFSSSNETHLESAYSVTQKHCVVVELFTLVIQSVA
jgi:hypothetical protein